MTGKLLIDWLQQRQRQFSHRQLLLVSGDLAWGQQRLAALFTQHTPALLLSDSALLNSDSQRCVLPNALVQCSIAQYKQHLGKEYQLVIYNAFDGVKPSALYAVEGCIGKSGLLVVLCPDIENWSHYEASHRGISFTHHTEHADSLFISRMRNILLADHSCALLSQQSKHLPFALASSEQLNETQSEGLMPEQQIAFDTLTTYIKKNADNKTSIAIIKARRGRGKSTLLGHLAAELGKSEALGPIYITAPHLNNAQQAQTEFKRLMTSDEVSKKHRNQLRYSAPDQLYNLPKQAILLIDEAAAIAPSILLFACGHFDTVVMATTVEGYEGSGLGFSLRVLPQLENLNASVISIDLSVPLRWHKGDTLEATFAKIFAPYPKKPTPMGRLQRHSAPISTTSPYPPNINVRSSDLHFVSVNRQRLIQHEFMLEQIFGLLIQSHYQTTPDDLMRILDSPDYDIVIICDNQPMTDQLGIILAVAIISREGNMSPEDPLLDDIVSSLRRVKGHLVVQNLAAALADKWFMSANSWRINRIAVAPEFRRSGLGSRLLADIETLAQQNDVDFLSTSFGVTPDLFAFWQTQGFALTKVGARRDTSSGEHSAIMLAPLCERVRSRLASYRGVMLNDMQYLLAYVMKEEQNNNSSFFIRELLQEYVNESELEHVTALENESLCWATHLLRIEQFLSGKRSLTNTVASIYYCVNKYSTGLGPDTAELLDIAHQKNRSKESKLDNLQRIKYSLNHMLKTK